VATGSKPQSVSFTQNAALVHSAHLEANGQAEYQQDVLDRRADSVEATSAAGARMSFANRAARDQARQALVARQAAEAAARAHSWQLPLKVYTLSSGFGFRWGRMHAGEDFATPIGTDLRAMSSGTVIFAGQESGFGNIVKIRYWDGTVSYYGHMSTISANVGDKVSPGDVVGQSGNTGHSTGPHLHLEIHPEDGSPVDPLPWLRDHGLLP